jgi:four helix bundle protein
MQDYRKLKVWKRGHEVTFAIYSVTRDFPKEESYGLVSQMRRAATSIPANIAEGSGRNSSAELNRFVTIASGSAFELDYYLLLARDLGFISTERYNTLQNQLAELKRMLNAFIQKLRTNNQKL